MKRLYVVTVSREVIVAAESREKAEAWAHSHGYEIRDQYPDVDAVPMTFMPGDWDADSIAYGNADNTDEQDRTVGQWIALGAAPVYSELLERFAKKGGAQ